MNYGKPCTQCGECCKNEVCKMGKFVYKEHKAPCKGLLYHDNKYWCECIEKCTTNQYHYLKLILGIGLRCDSE